jgi:hypothetical protein
VLLVSVIDLVELEEEFLTECDGDVESVGFALVLVKKLSGNNAEEE